MHSPLWHSGVLSSNWVVRTEVMRSHNPLQPDWLSIHITWYPARFSTSSKFSYSAVRASWPSRPRWENMQGSDAAVLVPQEVTCR